MRAEESQAVWTEYHERKKSQRMQEAAGLWAEMKRAGVNEGTVMALDFVHFGGVKADVESLAAQLSERYTTEVIVDASVGYWRVVGTTRPYGITLTEEQHLAWVEFMCDVAHSYSCAFSTWTLDAASLGMKFESEHMGDAG